MAQKSNESANVRAVDSVSIFPVTSAGKWMEVRETMTSKVTVALTLALDEMGVDGTLQNRHTRQTTEHPVP
ncbi:hypothetical protein CHS0354_038690 [Potamilus streckersoni]|uniref:Uncharacterized protein n=1 Tax=Potamilus streckersoni TaxID=2493646 RepID=A0AAE0VUR6_9BIVA|nr:hypothetical protein CHS0354_038690 [Potamilus streckersoni]